MMTCGDGLVRRGRAAGAGCGVPLLCLGGSDSPVFPRRVLSPRKARAAHAGHQSTCVKKPTLDSGRARVKGAPPRKTSTRLVGRGAGKTLLRRTHSELVSGRSEIVLVPELVNSSFGSVVRGGVGEGSAPLYDVPVPRVAKVTCLRRSCSVASSASRDVSSGNTHRSGERKSKKGCKDSTLSHSCMATKDLWYNKLCQVITEERDKEPPSTTIQVTYYDPVNSIDFSKTVSIGSTTTARDCVSLTLDHLEMGGADTSQFQLWVKTGMDDSPYPLIGHEFPYAIKMNCVRDLLQDCDAEQCNNLYNAELVTRCQFILRQARKLSFGSPEGIKKVSKKARKSPIRIHRVFKRANSKGESLDGSLNSCAGSLYGQSLVKLVEADNRLPKPVMDMLSQLFLKGPFTVGIFRKSANARLVRELREKLDSVDGDNNIDMDSIHITAVAALLKDFLRSMPDCLLVADLYEAWLELSHIGG
ncbi:Rho GTPase-activating protein 20 [Chionoecetes opilio]|uniref:Rho GTPase-activating protein 20 n=1 Tax=Chionoecetes opilio TaxID=41210 RepID=A0A8J4Y358_CHIOP|nr:Rho GTPase-activating protein 20 [Chionoecetes opilio]